MLKNSILLSALFILTILAGCSGHVEEYPWIDYVVEYPKHIDMVIDRDGRVRRSIQSGSGKGLYFSVKTTEFHLKPYEIEYLEGIATPKETDTYIQNYKRGEPFMVVHLDGKSHISLPKDENQLDNEESKEVVRFFKQLETRKAE